MLRFWNRILNFDSDRLLRRVFETDYCLCNNNWCSEIKTIMSQLELDEYFENKLFVNLESVKHKTASLYATNWSNWTFKDFPDLDSGDGDGQIIKGLSHARQLTKF